MGRYEVDAPDQAPPYWLTAGEEFGDDKHRMQRADNQDWQ
jgi:hypothetical protein